MSRCTARDTARAYRRLHAASMTIPQNSIESHERCDSRRGIFAPPGLRTVTAHAPVHREPIEPSATAAQAPEWSSEGEVIFLPVLSSQALAACVVFGVGYKSISFSLSLFI